MKRLLLSAFATLVVASTAHAASLTLSRQFVSVANPNAPGPGDVIRVLVTGIANAGEADVAAFGEILLSGPGSVVPNGPVTQVALESFGGAIPWVLGTNPCTGIACTMVNQICCLNPAPVTNTPLVIASVDFLLTSPDMVIAEWNESSFMWFGSQATEGICVTCAVIPEPATGSLLALGLASLAATSTRHRKN